MAGAGDDDQINIHGSPRCIEEEKSCLLELKAWLGSRMNHFNDDHSGLIKSNFLPSWVDHVDVKDQNVGNCCDGWEGITCDPLTGHILNLSLFNIYPNIIDIYRDSNFNSTWNSRIGFEKLSILKQLEGLYIQYFQMDSSFLPSLSTIKSLKVLDLSYNVIFEHGFSTRECEGLLGLSKLKELSLSFNSAFRGEPVNLSCMGSLPSLRSLFLDSNIFGVYSNPLPQEMGLGNLQQLQVLSMSYCGLGTAKGVKSLSLLSLPKMVKLKYLDLSSNHLKKDVLVEIFRAFPSLKFLNLAHNNFKGPLTNEDLIGFHHLETLKLDACGLNGTIPAQSLCKMNKLQELDLSDNLFEGDIPTCMNEWSFLRQLDLSSNRLSGNLSSSIFRYLYSLEDLNLCDNSFQGTFLFSTLANFSKLRTVRICNRGNLLIETELVEWVPEFQLKILDLSNCSMQKFPKFLFFQKDLLLLDLSLNRFEGSFPNWLLLNNTRLQYLYLQDNNFSGHLHLPQTKNQIIDMDISHNQLKGHIPANIDQLLPLLIRMSISFNAFDGAIPRSLGNMSSLVVLSMSSNNLVGEVPIEIMSVNSLFLLDLSSNNLSGCLSSFNLSAAEDLEYYIDISHNKMSGHIPRLTTDASNLTQPPLRVLAMRDNSFYGVFSCELFVAHILDISYNSLTGELPSCSGLYNSEHINIYGNKFAGVSETIWNLSSLITLDMGNNFFSGNIPNFIRESGLRVLLLRGNRFTGPIPHQLCKLEMLNVLDLSHNSFSGCIPNCLGDRLRFRKEHPGSFYYPSKSDFFYRFEVEFLSKYRINSYDGELLEMMSGLDLSSNYLEGQIPDALGYLSRIHSLNLSNNRLIGPIPPTFSNLMQIESLDLSHNNLSGGIPSNLTNLNFMGTFSVAYNNLSGRLPERKNQFGSFEADSYAGNPFLCGPPLERGCKVHGKNDDDNDADHGGHEAWYSRNDKEGFLASFMATYVVYILGFVTVLWINTRWRIRWFNFVEELCFSFYYFLSDILYKCFGATI